MIRVTILLGLASGFALAAPPLTTLPFTFGSSIIRAAAFDSGGNLYVTGTTYLSGTGQVNKFPATGNAFQKLFNLGSCNTQGSSAGCTDAFVAKLSPLGNVIYATYLGGSDNDEGFGIAVDSGGNAYVTGYTYSSDFPVTPATPQQDHAGPFPSPSSPNQLPPPGGDAFIAKINSDGDSLVYSTFLGGSALDVGNGIAVDSQGNAYVAGETQSADFPVTAGTYGQSLFHDSGSSGFVTKVDPLGTQLLFSSYFDAPAYAIALDASRNVYLTGTASDQFSTTGSVLQSDRRGSSDAFVSKLNSSATARYYATLLGGDDADRGLAIVVDSTGAAWVVGNTRSSDFPNTKPLQNQNGGAFIARLNSGGSGLVFSSRMGGNADDMVSTILLDGGGNAIISGQASASTFLTTTDALEKSTCSLVPENFIQKWSPQGSLLYSTFSREGIAATMDFGGNLYLVGRSGADRVTGSATLAKLSLSTAPVAGALACIMNAGSLIQSTGLAPGEIVSLFGDRLGPATGALFQLDFRGRISTSLANTRVLFDGVAAPLLYVQAGQINAIAPWELREHGLKTNVAVEYNGVLTPLLTVPVVDADPGIFRLDPKPGGQGAILNQDGSVNSASNPAKRGSVISIFATGTGLMNPQPQNGEIIQDANHRVASVGAIFTGSLSGAVSYAGGAPTIVAGLTQVNAQVPTNLSDSVVASGVTVAIKVGSGNPSPAVSVAVK